MTTMFNSRTPRLLLLSLSLFSMLAAGCQHVKAPKDIAALRATEPVHLPECQGPLYFVMLEAEQPGYVPGMAVGQFVDMDFLEELADLYRYRYGMDVQIVGPLHFEVSATLDPSHNQHVAERLIDRLQMGLSGVPEDAVIIGVLNEDMRIEQIPQWRYGFSLRHENMAVVSSFRMVHGGPNPQLARFRHRLHVMLSKDIAMLRCGYPLSEDPQAVTYQSVLGPADLDRMEFDLVSGRPSP